MGIRVVTLEQLLFLHTHPLFLSNLQELKIHCTGFKSLYPLNSLQFYDNLSHLEKLEVEINDYEQDSRWNELNPGLNSFKVRLAPLTQLTRLKLICVSEFGWLHSVKCEVFPPLLTHLTLSGRIL